ncbi:MAG: 2-dehydropantoate 2-reductase [Verrucomicrobiae bacterium]|nr:2-dehydropantoate 2-reductase [Verrucomicrobiae bacterium]MCB1092367.1 2-dehydropantoate 2-reductase [Verrucomicrobiae bacterium]
MISRHILPHYRIAVVGAGAVGCYYGGKLAQFGRDVHFLMRSDLAHVRKHGLRILSKQGNVHLPKINAYATTEEIGPVDLVLIAVKATANAALDTLLPPLLKPDGSTMLMTLQNGLGNDESLAERFGPERVLGGLCFVCLNRLSPGVIDHIGHGRIEMGEFSGLPLPRTWEVQGEFKRCGVVCSVMPDLGLARWRKLVWNVPFNGLSIAAGGIDVSRILADEDLLYLTRGLMDEVIGIARKLGHEIPDSFADRNIENTKSMGAYRTSSLIDFLEGREVEVEEIWGEPSRRGFNAGAEVGRLETLYRLIRRLVRERLEKPDGCA